MKRTHRALPAAVLLLAPLAACGDDSGGDAQQSTLTVLAASSLTGVFTDLKKQFESDHPGVTVTLAFDSSATLAQQVQEGAPADVLATADLATMKTVLDAGDADTSATFATNEMVLVVPQDNPAELASFGDLDQAGVSYVVCVDSAPCGKVAATLLDANGITAKPKSLEVDVKAVLAKVVADEADAGMVYATDAQAAGADVQELPVPGSAKVPNEYAVAVVDQTKDADLAQAWVDLVTGADGQKVLADAGFQPAG